MNMISDPEMILNKSRVRGRSGSPVKRRPAAAWVRSTADEEATAGSHRSPAAAGRSEPATAEHPARLPPLSSGVGRDTPKMPIRK